jgi:hypothetical protein
MLHALPNIDAINYTGFLISNSPIFHHTEWHSTLLKICSRARQNALVGSVNAQLDAMLQTGKYTPELIRSNGRNVGSNLETWSARGHFKQRCIAIRKHMTLSAQKLKMRCAHKSDAADVCAKLKAVSKLIAIYIQPGLQKFGASRPLAHGRWGRPLSGPYITAAISQGLRYVPTIFDHQRCMNSGFMAQNLGPLARWSSRIIAKFAES